MKLLAFLSSASIKQQLEGYWLAFVTFSEHLFEPAVACNRSASLEQGLNTVDTLTRFCQLLILCTVYKNTNLNILLCLGRFY